MAQVVQRIWRSGPRKVRRTAWGYTLQVDAKPSSVKMTERYAHLAPERLRDAVAAPEDFSTTSAQAPARVVPELVTIG
jgi:hypothetical protein